MKKSFVIISVFVCMSCAKEVLQTTPDTDSLQPWTTYAYKIAAGHEYLLEGFSNVTDTTFMVKDLAALNEALFDAEPGSIEVFDTENGRIVWPMITMVHPTETTNTREYEESFTFQGKSFTLYCRYYNWQKGANNDLGCSPYLFSPSQGDPLTTVCTCSNYWNNKSINYCNNFATSLFYSTSDLNEDCGVKSDYTYLFYGGLESNAEQIPCVIKDIDGIPEHETTVITGLRMVTQNNEDYAKEITDSDGIVWKIVPAYEGSNDLNNGAAGDYLYLYYTNDPRTGRKIYLIHPDVCKYLPVNEDADFDSCPFAYGVLFSIVTWTGSNTWDVDADKMIAQAGDVIANSNITPQENKDHIKNLFDGESRRFDFIRAYDRNMNVIDNRPANFNRNARGDKDIFISYSYITPQDPQWSNYSDGTEIRPLTTQY